MLHFVCFRVAELSMNHMHSPLFIIDENLRMLKVFFYFTKYKNAFTKIEDYPAEILQLDSGLTDWFSYNESESKYLRQVTIVCRQIDIKIDFIINSRSEEITHEFQVSDGLGRRLTKRLVDGVVIS